MEKLVFLFAIASLSVAQQYVKDPKEAAILSEKRYLSNNGQFGSAYTQEDGVQFTEESDQDGNRRGAYSYIDPSGQRRTITYTAGKNGFQASGDDIPVAPPAPPAPAPVAPQAQIEQIHYCFGKLIEIFTIALGGSSLSSHLYSVSYAAVGYDVVAGVNPSEELKERVEEVWPLVPEEKIRAAILQWRSDQDGNRRGAYSYIDPSGQRRTITYTAGKNGFQASGDDIPVAPPAPPAPAPVAPQAPAAPQAPVAPAAGRQYSVQDDSAEGQYHPIYDDVEYWERQSKSRPAAAAPAPAAPQWSAPTPAPAQWNAPAPQSWSAPAAPAPRAWSEPAAPAPAAPQWRAPAPAAPEWNAPAPAAPQWRSPAPAAPQWSAPAPAVPQWLDK
ncbi:uncharacterized protein LOC103506099 [Diaphorina citri]|uniref:Uncharacterized protein LOC103506099 n=1 Tax=Diaphorina citri TaxID=121845 RepID=A0A3Q0ILF9_DIACI|nr:uncharacterized protein LOC103506099 [Diaphorina citri]